MKRRKFSKSDKSIAASIENTSTQVMSIMHQLNNTNKKTATIDCALMFEIASQYLYLYQESVRQGKLPGPSQSGNNTIN